MMKSVAVGAAALAIVGSSIVYAQQRSGAPDGLGGVQLVLHHRPSVDDVKAFTDARIAALKAGLQLTPDQEKNWPPFEQALRDMAKLRIERLQARQARAQAPAATPFDRLAQRADAMAKRGAALKHVAETGAPLYQSLSDAQKERFSFLARMLRPHHHHFAWHDGEGDGRRGRWFRHDEQGPDGPMHRMMDLEQRGSEL